jgi:hypothetical protein
MFRLASVGFAVVVAGIMLAGCSSDRSTPLDEGGLPTSGNFDPTTSGEPDLQNSGGFVAEITNPYLAFSPGKIFRYEGETDEGLETHVVEVTSDTRLVYGVMTTVVHEQAFLDDVLIEDTFDWYAQDAHGTVWYFGEHTVDIPTGSTKGSWEAGIGGASPGIIMLAEPMVGAKYQQEYFPGVAEDQASVISLDASVEVRYGTYTGALDIEEWTPLEPSSREHKFYASDVGLLLEVSSDGERLELVSIE